MSTAPLDTAPGTPDPGRQPRAAIRFALRRYVRVAPAAIGLAVVVLAVSIVTGTLWSPANVSGDALIWAAGVSTTIHAGYWWTPVTALFVPEGPIQIVVAVGLALTALAVAERLLGTVRMIIAFLVTGVLGITIGVLGQWLAASAGELLARVTAFDFTLAPTIGIAGALIAASGFAGPLWRRRIRLLTFASVLMLVLYNGDQNNVYRLIAALLGLALGVAFRRARLRRIRRASHAETRNLVAALVAITALGPLAALLPPGGFGPFSFVSALFRSEQVDVAHILAQCATADTSTCRSELAIVAVQGVGPLMLTLLPLVLLLVAAIGLRRGRHFALILGIAVNAAMIVLPFTALPLSVAFDIDGFEALTPLVELSAWLLAVLLVPVASIGLLLAARRQFQIRAPRDAVLRFWILAIVSFSLLAVAYLVAGLATLVGYVPDASIGDVFVSALRRFVPAGFESVLGPVIVPTSTPVLLLYQWVGPAFWIVFVLGVLRLYRATSTGRTPGDRVRFHELLRAGGGGTLGFRGTWSGNVYWFAEEGDGAVAYRVADGVAIALSDPVCPPGQAERTIIDFVAFCEANSWVPVFYGTHDAVIPVFESLGWRTVAVGEETRIRPQAFDPHGTTVRKEALAALHSGIDERISTVWTSWDALAPIQQTEIVALNEQWVAEKELPELGFALGGPAELRDADVRLLIAYGPDGELQGITSWLPSWRGGRIAGYTLDFLRRSDASIPGIAEFLIATAAQRMHADGVESLGLSRPWPTQEREPMGEEPDDRGGLDRLLVFLTRTLEPAYRFEPLFRLADTLEPTRETLWLACPDLESLPTITRAIGRSYLPDADAREYRELTGGSPR